MELHIKLPDGVVPPVPAWMQILLEVGAWLWVTRRWISVLVRVCVWFWTQAWAWNRKADNLGQIHMDHFDYVSKMNQSSDLRNPDLCRSDVQYTWYTFFWGDDLCSVTFQNIFHMLVMSSVVNCDFYSRLKFRNTIFFVFNVTIKINESFPMKTAVPCSQTRTDFTKNFLQVFVYLLWQRWKSLLKRLLMKCGLLRCMWGDRQNGGEHLGPKSPKSG